MVLLPLAKTRTDNAAGFGVAASAGIVERIAGTASRSVAAAAGTDLVSAFLVMALPPRVIVRFDEDVNRSDHCCDSRRGSPSIL
jgi:hypothetical protein